MASGQFLCIGRRKRIWNTKVGVLGAEVPLFPLEMPVKVKLGKDIELLYHLQGSYIILLQIYTFSINTLDPPGIYFIRKKEFISYNISILQSLFSRRI